jgi:lipopolysaccharide transport system ATP-binding protein
MKPIIEVRNLSKKYKIGERQRYLSLRDSVSNIFSKKNTEGSEFWALDDVSFDIHAGESIGIIGRNGAGKSTLLKILSRITPPTKGSVILRGRMASLLEVGTGFHSELTGRENVFMNGSILGLKKREIEAKFDEIVDFSGVEQFIDTPLKHFSSGMQLRLAFAVAAHLEPEILVIDEVLAVGDMEFQKRCLGKMDEVSRSGRTVLFVSHNLSTILQLCSKSILLDRGKIIEAGVTKEVVNRYSLNSQHSSFTFNFVKDKIEDCFCKLLNINFIDNKSNIINELFVNDFFCVEFVYQIKKEGYRPTANFLLLSSMNEKIFQSLPANYNIDFEVGIYRSVCNFPANFLNNLNYKFIVALTSHNPTYIHCQTELFFEVKDNMFAPTRGDYKGEMHGVIRPLLNWKTEKIE